MTLKARKHKFSPSVINCSRYQIIRGILWTINDGVAEVATGDSNQSCMVSIRWKRPYERMEIPYDGFAQVNDEGAELLMQCIAEATESSTTLFDLYCGSGAIGIALSDNFESVTGIELQPEAIERAKRNAKQNNVSGTWISGKVEDCLPKAIGNENVPSYLVLKKDYIQKPQPSLLSKRLKVWSI